MPTPRSATSPARGTRERRRRQPRRRPRSTERPRAVRASPRISMPESRPVRGPRAELLVVESVGCGDLPSRDGLHLTPSWRLLRLEAGRSPRCAALFGCHAGASGLSCLTRRPPSEASLQSRPRAQGLPRAPLSSGPHSRCVCSEALACSHGESEAASAQVGSELDLCATGRSPETRASLD